MKCRWYQFHKWQNIYEEVQNKYLDEEYTSYTSNLKVCRKCGTVKEYNYDSQGGYWNVLDEQKTKIVHEKMDFVGDKLVIKRKTDEK